MLTLNIAYGIPLILSTLKNMIIYTQIQSSNQLYVNYHKQHTTNSGINASFTPENNSCMKYANTSYTWTHLSSVTDSTNTHHA